MMQLLFFANKKCRGEDLHI